MANLHASATRRITIAWLALAAVVAPTAPLVAQDVQKTLANFAESDRVETSRLARSPSGRDVVLATVSGARSGEEPPAILVLAGADPTHRIGIETGLALIERLAAGYGSDSTITAILDRVTVHVVPLLNPDAASAADGGPVRERVRNGLPIDDDRDGLVDEDGPDDLNGDGLITLVRIDDPTGGWTEDEDDPGLMRKAEPARGDRPAWRVLTEGVDDDSDGQWNEDPPGGVAVGSNFPHRYPWFGPAAGPYPVAAPEARAVAELLTDRSEIGTVVVLGPQDNLVSPWTPRSVAGDSPGTEAGDRLPEPPDGLLAEDEPWFEEISRRYRDRTGRTSQDTLGTDSPGGDPLSWAYYHMGRWAFGSSVWTPPADSTEISADSLREVSPGSEAVRRRLRWLRSNRPQDVLDWTPIDHPDFPDRRAEVGGLVPFTRWTPPAGARDSIIQAEVDFLLELATLLPRLSIREARAERLGEATWRVTAQIENAGVLPTRPVLADRLGRPRSIRVDLETDGQGVVGGRSVQVLDGLPGRGSAVELSWVVVGRGGGSLHVRAETPTAGADRKEVRLP